MTVLVDSDVLIEVSRGKRESVISKWMALSTSDSLVLFSTVSLAELWAGARPAEYESLQALFDTLKCVPADAGVGLKAGEYLRLYGKSHGVELGDALIAASVFVSGAALWTQNRKHYPMKELTFFE